MRWRTQGEGAVTLAANLSAVPAAGFPAADGQVIWQEGQVDADGTFGPWAVRWSVEPEASPELSKVGAPPRTPPHSQSGPEGPEP